MSNGQNNRADEGGLEGEPDWDAPFVNFYSTRLFLLDSCRGNGHRSHITGTRDTTLSAFWRY